MRPSTSRSALRDADLDLAALAERLVDRLLDDVVEADHPFAGRRGSSGRPRARRPGGRAAPALLADSRADTSRTLDPVLDTSAAAASSPADAPAGQRRPGAEPLDQRRLLGSLLDGPRARATARRMSSDGGTRSHRDASAHAAPAGTDAATTSTGPAQLVGRADAEVLEALLLEHGERDRGGAPDVLAGRARRRGSRRRPGRCSPRGS